MGHGLQIDSSIISIDDVYYLDNGDDDYNYIEITYTVGLNETVAPKVTDVIRSEAHGENLRSKFIEVTGSHSALSFNDLEVPTAVSIDDVTVTCGMAYVHYDTMYDLFQEPTCNDMMTNDTDSVHSVHKWGYALADIGSKCCTSSKSTCPRFIIPERVPYDPTTCNQAYNYHDIPRGTCGDCRVRPFSVYLHRRHQLQLSDCIGYEFYPYDEL